VIHVTGQAELAKVAQAFCFDTEMADLLGEMISVVGTDGYLDVQSSNGRSLHREYVEGAFWRQSSLLSSAFADPKNLREAELYDAVLMLIDGRIQVLEPMVDAVNRILKAGHQTLCCVCRQMADPVVSVMAHNHAKGNFKFLAVKTSALPEDRKAMLDDLAALTGGTILAMDWDADMTQFTPDMLGKARRVRAEYNLFGVTGARVIRRRCAPTSPCCAGAWPTPRTRRRPRRCVNGWGV
jgi:chaperonin GroEL